MKSTRTIVVRYRAVDGFRMTRRFKTIEGARNFAFKYIGEHPEFGTFYAVSADGVGMIEVAGATLAELYPQSPEAYDRAWRPF